MIDLLSNFGKLSFNPDNPTVMVDIDDVLNDCIHTLHRVLNKAHSRKLTYLEQTVYNLDEAFDLAPGTAMQTLVSEEFWADFEPFKEGTKEFLKNLSKTLSDRFNMDADYNIVVCTSRGGLSVEMTRHLLHKFNRLELKEVVLVAVDFTACKFEALKSINIEPDIVIEDSPSTLQKAQKRGMQTIVRVRPYNVQHLTYASGVMGYDKKTVGILWK